MNVPHPVDLNNIAITRLQEEKSCEALYLLRMALTDVKETFRSRELYSQELALRMKVGSRPTSICHPVSEVFNSSFTSVSTVDDEEAELQEDMNVIHEDLLSDQQSTIQSIPLVLDADQNRRLSDHSIIALFDRVFYVHRTEEVDDEFLSCVLLYNMGLTNHLSGIRNGDQENMATALKLYEMSLTIALRTKSLPIDASLLILALYNNMAHIYAQRSASDKTKFALVQMTRMLETANNPVDCLSEDDYVLFFLNTMILFGGELNFHAAPAA